MSVGDSLVLSDLQFLINVQYPIVDTTDQNGFLSSKHQTSMQYSTSNFAFYYTVLYSEKLALDGVYEIQV